MVVKYSKNSVKYTKTLDKPTRQRLKIAIENIPFGDIKKLQGSNSGYRLRVGNLRMLFDYDGNTVNVVNILPRGQAYNRI